MFGFSGFLAQSALALVTVLFGLHVFERFSERLRGFAERLRDAEHLFWVPVFFIAEHRPSQDCDLAAKGDGGFFLASLLLAADTVVHAFGPWVVTQRCPGAFDKNRTCKRIATFGDASVTVRFTRLVLSWD